MYEAPKKALQSDRRFICSTVVKKKRKDYIFRFTGGFLFMSGCECEQLFSDQRVHFAKLCLRRLVMFKKAFILEGSHMN